MKAAPTILEPTPEEIVNQINRLSPYFPHFQIDIQDGVYIKNKTASLTDLLSYLKNNNIVFKNNTFNIDLMTHKNEKDVALLPSFSEFMTIDSVLVHHDQIESYEALKQAYPQYKFGFSLSKEDSVSELHKSYDLKEVPIIQIMTIELGPQGQPFIPELLNKIDQLYDIDYRNIISLDGALNNMTIPTILERQNKPDILYIGSFLTKTNDLQSSIDFLNTHLT